MSTVDGPFREPRYFMLGRMDAIQRAARREMLEAIRAAGYPYLRMPHVALLAHMTAEGRRIGEFAELMQVTKSAASQLVTFLESHGLVERVADPSDGRAVLVRATPAADLGFKVARTRYAKVEDEWAQILGRSRLRGVWRSLLDLERWQPARHRRKR
ncbi:MAG: MarR family winged helix-turn-helix transcriptional regulator [Candidatus Dormibacteria bacterium]